MKPSVLLIYPNVSREERYKEIGIAGLLGGHQIPLGVFALAAWLRERGYPVGVIDAETQNLSPDQIARRCRLYDIIGISSTSLAFPRAVDAARAIRGYWPDKPIILGGPHVSCMPEHPLQHDCFDYAIRNEGEETLVETLEALGDVRPSDDPGWRLAAVRGLIWRRNGEVVINPPRPYMEDLDRLPSPAYDLIPDLTAYHPPAFCYSRSPVLNVHTSRGCPGQCTFCDRSVFGGKFRARSAKAVADDIETLIRRYGAREIAFMDDTFTVSKPRVYEIFRILRERGLRFPWSCMSRISTVDEPLLKFMRENGCWHIAFGIESGNASVLKVIRKGADLGRIEQVIRYCDQIGIKTKGFFMLGHPSDTPESIQQTIEFGVRLPIRDLVVTVNTPWPGTWQFEHAREFGTREDFSFDRWNHWNPVFVPHGLTAEFLLKKHKEFIRRFYMRPRAVWNILRTPGLLRQLWALAVAYFKHRKTAQSHE